MVPSSRHPSPSTPAANRIARISACAVGSPSASRAFTARASSVPSAPTTTAPTGTSRGPAVAATANAARIRSSSVVTARACGHRPRRSITADSWSAKPISRAMRPSCSSA
ncbi:Uncharacterised protein [Mycobacterium tuberculosis]|nr:Uncharacterised protein [Mycobacterium tuberculosis]